MFHESFISITANNQTLASKWTKIRYHETEGCAFICNYTENVCVDWKNETLKAFLERINFRAVFGASFMAKSMSFEEDCMVEDVYKQQKSRIWQVIQNLPYS
jgi:hypothetical protein